MQRKPSEATIGAFLRARREQMTAPAHARRRTPGLRREEVAERAGVSTDWYVRLEQNRAESASSIVLDRVASALELTPPERRYLFRLAGREEPAPLSPAAPHVSASTVLRLVTDAPACILGPRIDVLEANERYLDLFLGLGTDPRFGRNMVWFMCCDPRAPSLMVDHDAVIAEAVATLRASFARHANDPRFHALISELTSRSPTFAARWTEHGVRERSVGRKRFDHPTLGKVAFDYHALASPEAPDQLLVVYARV